MRSFCVNPSRDRVERGNALVADDCIDMLHSNELKKKRSRMNGRGPDELRDDERTHKYTWLFRLDREDYPLRLKTTFWRGKIIRVPITIGFSGAKDTLFARMHRVFIVMMPVLSSDRCGQENGDNREKASTPPALNHLEKCFRHRHHSAYLTLNRSFSKH